MKPRQPSSATILASPQQTRMIGKLADKHLEEGGSMLAQVFTDGLRVRVLTPDQTRKIQQALSEALDEPSRAGLMRRSVFQGDSE